MLTEAEQKRVTIHSFSPDNKNTISNEAVIQLINTREPCSGNTALHWAAKHGVNKIHYQIVMFRYIKVY